MRQKSERGSALVELAVLTPVLSMLLLGTVWFGYTFYTYNQLEKAIHDAARYASTRSMVGDTAAGRQYFTDDVKRVAVYGITGSPSYPVVPNLTTSNINVVLEGTLNERPKSIRVEVTNYSVPGLFGAITINKPVTRFPYIGAFYSTVVPEP